MRLLPVYNQMVFNSHRHEVQKTKIASRHSGRNRGLCYIAKTRGWGG